MTIKIQNSLKKTIQLTEEKSEQDDHKFQDLQDELKLKTKQIQTMITGITMNFENKSRPYNGTAM